MHPKVVRQIVFNSIVFNLNNAFCKPVSCELSKKHLLNLTMAFPAHRALSSFNGYVLRVNQRLTYCLNGPIIYELSMPKI